LAHSTFQRGEDITGTKMLLIAQVFISDMMALLMTGFFGFLHFGPTARWLSEWFGAFVIAWPVAFCLSLVVADYPSGSQE
jgi:O-antigen/teichoic acid export membrane protein